MGSTTLLTFGTFDTPHVGHAALLRRCERYADRVVVGVNSDYLAELHKGRRPLFTLEERMDLIEELGYEVVPVYILAREVIGEVKPDVLAIGSDWAGRDWLATLGIDRAYLDDRGTAILYIPYTRGISTSLIRERCSR